MDELYKNLLYELGELRISCDPDDEVWVYLKRFKDDDILSGKYIYNYGIMSSEMKKGIGKTIDYGSYTQEIVSMTFKELKRLYEEQLENEMILKKISWNYYKNTKEGNY